MQNKTKSIGPKEAESVNHENFAHSIFIREMIKHGNRIMAYQAAYPGVCLNTARVNACRLLGDSNIAAQVHAGLMSVKEVLMEQFKDFYERKLACEQEKREILAKITRGEMEIEKEIPKGEGKVLVKQRPDMKDVLRAILIDNYMEKNWKDVFKFPASNHMF